MPAQVRPPLGMRALSEMSPLVSPAPNTQQGEIGRGTHVVQGGMQVTSGKRLAFGGVAPISPFLPLPPAPTASQVRLRCHLQGDATAGNDADTLSQAELNELAWSSRQPTSTAMSKRPPPSQPAPFMIRSYSMPVATQRDFDTEQRKRLNGQRQHSASSYHAPSWSTMSRINNESTAPTATERLPLRTVKQSELNSPPTMARGMSRTATALAQGRKWDASHSDAASSDEADVRTPRAVSPIAPIVGASSDACDNEDELDDAYFFTPESKTSHHDALHSIVDLHIHPDHMQPPAMWSA